MSESKLPIDATLGMSRTETSEFDGITETMVPYLKQLDELPNKRPSIELIEATPALGLLSLRGEIQEGSVVPIGFARLKRLH